MSEHGASYYVHHRCRCAVCSEANRDRCAEQKRARMATRVLVDGRLVATAARRHGIWSTYSNWSCRCEPCVAAGARKNRAARARREVSA